MNMQRCARCGKKFDNVRGKCPTCGWESRLGSQADTAQPDGESLTLEEIVGLIEALEGEVNNGGFHQYFYNSAGDNTPETIQALETIGALAMADIVKRAADKFPAGMPPKDRFARQDVLLEKFPHAVGFKDLDEEFYGYPDDLSGLLAKYRSK